MLVEQIITNQMQPLVWPSLHADLGRLVVTDECFLAYCYEEGWEGGCWDEYPGSTLGLLLRRPRRLRRLHRRQSHRLAACLGDHPARAPVGSQRHERDGVLPPRWRRAGADQADGAVDGDPVAAAPGVDGPS